MTLNLLVVVCDFLIGFFVISTGGGGAALYLGVLTGLCGLSAAHAVDTSLLTAIPALCFGALSFYRHGNVNVKLARQFLYFALPTVIVASLLARYIPEKIYAPLIGLVRGSNVLSQGAPNGRYPRRPGQGSLLRHLIRFNDRHRWAFRWRRDHGRPASDGQRYVGHRGHV